jgi:hypothetical protein
MWNVSAGDLGVLLLVGIVAVGFADIMGALVAGQHRDPATDQWDRAHGFGAPAPHPRERPPLKHRAKRVWRRTYTSHAITKARDRTRTATGK